MPGAREGRQPISDSRYGPGLTTSIVRVISRRMNQREAPVHIGRVSGAAIGPYVGLVYRAVCRGCMSNRMSDRIIPYNRRLSGRISGHISGGYLVGHLERPIGRCIEGRVIKAGLSSLTQKADDLLPFRLSPMSTPQGNTTHFGGAVKPESSFDAQIRIGVPDLIGK